MRTRWIPRKTTRETRIHSDFPRVFLKALYKVLDVAQLFQQGGADDLGERLIQLGIFVTCDLNLIVLVLAQKVHAAVQLSLIHI